MFESRKLFLDFRKIKQRISKLFLCFSKLKQRVGKANRCLRVLQLWGTDFQFLSELLESLNAELLCLM